MRKLFFTFMLAVAATTAMAIPAKRVTRVVNINGKSVTLTLKGDENLHYWQAEDGATYRMIDDQRVEVLDMSYALANRQIRQTAQMKESSAMAATPDGMSRAAQMRRTKYSGQKRGLVILANFKDKSFTISNPQATYQDAMSKEGYKDNGQYGSVRDYFYAQSYGQFDFVLDVVGPVTLSQKMEYYGANDNNGNDIRPAHMAKEACQLADAAGVDFTQYDWDGDGKVEQVFIIYAGYGEAQGAAANTIWPHAWQIEGSGSTLYLDGKRISSYACGSELNGYSGTKMDGIGTICHEFSHCFGLPDFYCTDYGHDNMTMGSWSIMDHGSYNNNGYTPAAYTAYERWFCGWLEPKELTAPIIVKELKDIETEGDAYILYNQGNKNEYYIMYNIQQTGWNTKSPGHGMLVLHVDYDKSAWDANTPNNDASHLRMAPICADNAALSTTNSYKGDPYPGGNVKKNRLLTDTSTPAATLFNKNTDGRYYMGKPIEEITEANKVISFVFDGGVPPAEIPENITIDHCDSGFKLTWDAAANAATYDVMYGVYDKDALNNITVYTDLTIDFNRTSDSSSDISGKLDDNLSIKGFTGSKLYPGKSGLKFGSSSAKGILDTPVLEIDGEQVEVTVVVNQYSTKESTFSIVRLDDAGNELEDGPEFTIDSGNMTFKAILNTEGMSKIRIKGTKERFYLQKLTIQGFCNPYGEPTFIEDIEETTVEIAPEPLLFTTYYACVRGVNSKRDSSDWSAAQTILLVAPESEVIPGDVNGDGNIDVVDVTTLISYIIGEAPEIFIAAAADVSGDGTINVLDVTSLIDIILSK